MRQREAVPAESRVRCVKTFCWEKKKYVLRWSVACQLAETQDTY
jgi:hypothetical protein